jgi:hypothetical protein
MGTDIGQDTDTETGGVQQAERQGHNPELNPASTRRRFLHGLLGVPYLSQEQSHPSVPDARLDYPPFDRQQSMLLPRQSILLSALGTAAKPQNVTKRVLFTAPTPGICQPRCNMRETHACGLGEQGL